MPSWFHLRPPPLPEDPAVARVEETLDAAASHSAEAVPRRNGRPVVTHAVWLCACETENESPTWLIYAVGENGIGWQRVPDRTDVCDAVEAEHFTGCHPAPEAVLDWVRGEAPYPWPGHSDGDFPEHSYVYDEISRRLCST